MPTRFAALAILAALAAPLPAADPGPWATYRGNPQRTGNTDNQPGPAAPAVLWTIRSQDHFVASPVPVGTSVYLSGLGAFNRPAIALYPAGGTGEPKATWARSAPYLRLASVSSPAVSGNYLVFGDGMHQDSGGVLHCLTADTGRPIWQLPMPGDLIHLEGAPTVADGKVYMGAGAGGVLCVDLTKVTLDGKEYTPAEIEKLQDEKWKQLLAKFEEDKKKDKDLAVPPSEDDLLKPAPKVVWKKGEVKWHVDAPVCVTGDKVLVCTSYLDQEKVGERALYCLNAATGETLWTKPLALNPWGGASVLGNTVVVSGSSVGYYYTKLKGAKGNLAAFDLATGAPKWTKDVPGGIVGCVALADGLAVCTATDGKVRAFNLADGDRRWIYEAKTPLFAPPAVAGGVVYAGDLNGVIHAIDLKDGAGKWKLDLGADPAVRAPGMVYGGVTAHGGKLYVATCNLEGPLARKPTCVVCIGTK
ncbi:PQQ-binding-like beta-propeller repeat protein [Fimbriiglobus ruber]|uniref:Putative cell surface protein/ lipoprotein n=1 Tax=Fimbriiglobus ruber TaxID=1908690 RepID=A0A225DM98_9BACT|nr:PQQ-binding-like beta-propeller repeat protein [Fimbriiglobus ruber]OWK38339.1 putative cell surface protein/ lipoprotein [Fimbriiglobus ruber]